MAGIPAKVIGGQQEHDPSLTMKHGKQALEHASLLRITPNSLFCPVIHWTSMLVADRNCAYGVTFLYGIYIMFMIQAGCFNLA